MGNHAKHRLRGSVKSQPAADQLAIPDYGHQQCQRHQLEGRRYCVRRTAFDSGCYTTILSGSPHRPLKDRVAFHPLSKGLFAVKKQKAGEEFFSGLLLKDWRRPTLAEPIGLLPSARLRLTAEFGMGSGRTTALWPPKSDR